MEEPDLANLAGLLDKLNLQVVIETGARFLLHPKRKHYPSLVSSEGRQIRIEFLRRAIDIAAVLNAECVSFWSGIAERNVPEHQSWDWLVTGCQQVTEHAKRRGVQLGFEPEPGMLVDDMAKFEVLKKHLSTNRFGLTLDIGHVFCTETAPFRQVFGKFGNLIRNIHIEDIKGRRHQHLMFGDGDLDFEAILKVIRDNRYTGLVNVELSRDSHRGPDVAQRSLDFLNNVCRQLDNPSPSSSATR